MSRLNIFAIAIILGTQISWSSDEGSLTNCLGVWNGINSEETITITQKENSNAFTFSWLIVESNGHTRDIENDVVLKNEGKYISASINSDGCIVNIKITGNTLSANSKGKCSTLSGGPSGDFNKFIKPDEMVQMQAVSNTISALQGAYYLENNRFGYLKSIGYQYSEELPFTVNGSLIGGQYSYIFKDNEECGKNPILVTIQKESFKATYKINDQRCKVSLQKKMAHLGMSLEE